MNVTFAALNRASKFVGCSFFSKSEWNTPFLLAQQIFVCLVVISSVVFTSGYLVHNSKDSTLLIEGACIWSTGTIPLFSLHICLIFRHQLRKCITEMAFQDRMLDMPLVQHCFSVNNEIFFKLTELREMVIETQKKLLKYTLVGLKAFLVSVLGVSFLYVCDAIIRFLIRSHDLDRPLGFPMWFPWSLKSLPIYTATFLFHVYVGFICAVAYPSFQITIMILIGQVVRQLKIMSFILLNLNELGLELGRNTEEWQLYCTEIQIQCVKHYVMLKGFSRRLNTVTQYFYLALILNAILLVCVVSVKIAISDKTALHMVKYYIHLVSYVMMVLAHCMLGQEVDNQSEKLEQVATEKWYVFNRQHKKNVLIFTMALSQRMPIYIFGSITLSLPTFTWFIKMGMSFFTLVMSVLEEK